MWTTCGTCFPTFLYVQPVRFPFSIGNVVEKRLRPVSTSVIYGCLFLKLFFWLLNIVYNNNKPCTFHFYYVSVHNSGKYTTNHILGFPTRPISSYSFLFSNQNPQIITLKSAWFIKTCKSLHEYFGVILND